MRKVIIYSGVTTKKPLFKATHYWPLWGHSYNKESVMRKVIIYSGANNKETVIEIYALLALVRSLL